MEKQEAKQRKQQKEEIKGKRELRIFLSSPFGGMEEERELLMKRYVPLLRRRSAAVGVSLFVVDLRWGITDKVFVFFVLLLTVDF